MSRREPVSDEDAERGRALAEWRLRYPELWGFEVEWDEELGIPIPVIKRSVLTFCGARMRNGEVCGMAAGTNTAHLGVGACWRHDSQVERAAGAWAMAHKIAEIVDISPWDALLLAVKRAAAWAAFYDTKLAQVQDDDDLRPSGQANDWVRAAERVNDKLARYSKMAVDAGVAAMLVQQAKSEGALIAQVVNRALGVAELDEAVEARIRAALRQALTEMGPNLRVVEGSVVEEPDEDGRG